MLSFVKRFLFLSVLVFSMNSYSQVTSNTNDSWIDFTKPHLKIGVASDGIYRLKYDDLVRYGFNIQSINPNKLVLFSKGQKIPIYVSGRNDNQFDTNDYIEFAASRNMGGKHREISQYNQSYNEYLGRYTDTTVYWLTWRDNENSLIEIANYSPTNNVIEYYNEVIHYERNIALDYSIADIFRRELPYWSENKTWIESLLNVGTKNYQFSLSDIYPNQKAYILAKLQDYASDVSNKPHLVAIGVNTSKMFDTTQVDRYKQAVLKAEISSNLLLEGNNTVKLQSLPTQASVNVLAVDWVEIEYPRRLKAINDSLKFSFPFIANRDLYEIRITNVNKENIAIWKNGINGKKYNYNKNGSTISFTDSVDKGDLYFICCEDKIRTPKIYYTKQFTNLESGENSYDYILITHNKFKSISKDYSKFISDNYNLRVTVVDVNEIYDQYSYGFFNPEAIRDFLKGAFNKWKLPKYKYVFLVGGATYDYFGNKAKYQGAPLVYNYVPSFGASVSDSWFVIFDSTKSYVPDVSIGRIPVTTVQEFEWYFQKHKEYLQQPFNAWNKKVLFFSSGTGNDQAQLDALRNVNEFIINNYVKPKPLSANYTHFFKTINPVNNFGPYSQSQITAAIDSGSVFISYLGHSGTQTWDNSITDPKQLQNKVDRYPLITDFGCSTARFAEPDVISFSQSFVNNGQAIAYIGNSSLGFTSTSYSFPQIFYKKLLADSIYTIGDAHRLAKLELISKYGSSSVYQLFALTNTLIGDPVIKIKIPPKPNLYIHGRGIIISDKYFSDTQDSLNLIIVFHNYGLVKEISHKILIQDFYKNSINYSKEILRPIPENVDSIFIKIPVRGLNGEHKISIILDKDNIVNEIYENDNSAEAIFVVPSGSLKYLTTAQVENYFKNPFRILSPTQNRNVSSALLELSTNEKFINSFKYQLPLDTIKTDFNIDSSLLNKRIWLRTKITEDDSMASVISFKTKNKNSFAIYDSLSFSKQNSVNFKLRNNPTLDSSYTSFKLISAGLNDGNTALILKDGQNYIPENTLRGHHVAIFKGKNYQYAGYKLFDVYGGGTAVTNDYIKFLDTLSSDYLVAFTLSDEGTVSSSALRNKIKEFGSKYIDNVSFRSSWVMLGRKGAKTGTVPEKYSKQYQGRAEVDTVMLSDYRSGELETVSFGPAEKWLGLNLGLSGSTNYFNIKILGSYGEKYDTLFSWNERKVSYDLSSIDTKKYPYLKLLLKVSSDKINEIVKIDSLVIDYVKPPELILSNKTISLPKDTLAQGEVIKLKYRIDNVGESTAKNINVALQLLRADGYKLWESKTVVDSIKPDSKKYLSFEYDTKNISGTIYLVLNIDPENLLNEIYTDNNYLTVPFYVHADKSIPSVQIKFDEVDIFDGDYVSSNPNIKIDVNNNSIIPLTDTTSVELYLNNKRLNFRNNNQLTYHFNDSNPKMIINYKPTLDNGEYLLKIVAKNPNNSLVANTTVQKRFLVSKEAKLMYVYNYPNPFSDKTYFTFKLTQIPDELKIRVYTLSGRLIKEIIKTESELNYDFNNIEWDGRDADGSTIANGVYIYKVIMKKGSEVITATDKLAVVR